MWQCRSRADMQFNILSLLTLLVTINASPHKPGAITLLQQDRSFAAYMEWNYADMKGLKFRFKTYLKDCFLLFMENNMMKTSLELAIYKGRLRAVAKYENNVQEVFLNLQGFDWHQVRISFDPKGVYIHADNKAERIYVDDLQFSSRVYIGGRLGIMTRLLRFKGCIDSLTYTRKNGRDINPALVAERGTTFGCLNACTKNTCQHGGKCLNRFTTTACDCKATEYEGPKCTKKADTVFLPRADYIRVNISSKSVAVHDFSLSTRLKTQSADGLLFAVDELEKGFNIAITKGRIKLAIHKLDFTIGDGKIHDAKWHYLTVRISNKMVTATLDSRFTESRTIPEANKIFMFPLYVGGIPKNILDRGTLISNDFTGCLQQLYVNENNIIWSALYMVNDRRVSLSNELSSQCPIENENKFIHPGLPTRISFGKREEETKNADTQGDRVHPKIIESNRKDMIAWIISGVVSGVIVLMVITACAINYFRFKYDGIFLSQSRRHDSCPRHLNGSLMQMHSKQSSINFSPQRKIPQVVRL